MTDVLENPRAVMGGNNPPEPTPFEAFSVHTADLMETAQGFLDGEPVTTQDMANTVSRLMDDCRRTGKDADAARAAEKKPLDDEIKSIQAKWKPLIERCETATSVCKTALKPFLEAQEVEKRRIADAATVEAERKANEAAEVARAARATDLAAQEHALSLEREAKRAVADANRADKVGGRATGGARATTLRSYFTAELTDLNEAVKHYWTDNRAAFEALVQRLADEDVRSGKRQLPGFAVREERRVV